MKSRSASSDCLPRDGPIEGIETAGMLGKDTIYQGDHFPGDLDLVESALES